MLLATSDVHPPAPLYTTYYTHTHTFHRFLVIDFLSTCFDFFDLRSFLYFCLRLRVSLLFLCLATLKIICCTPFLISFRFFSGFLTPEMCPVPNSPLIPQFPSRLHLLCFLTKCLRQDTAVAQRTRKRYFCT